MSIFSGLLAGLMPPVGNNRPNGEDNVAGVRTGLTRLNYRTDEDKGDNIFTRGLHNAIKLFQRDENLDEDGWLAPGGPTEERLGTRVAQNNRTQSDAATDRILGKATDDEVMGLIEKGEGNKSKPYLDTKGNVTVGIGAMIPNAEEAKTYPFYIMQGKTPIRRATGQEIETSFNKLKASTRSNRTAVSYTDETDIGLREEDIMQRARQRLRSEAEALRRKFNGFDDSPKKVQMGLLDQQYNIGDDRFNIDFTDKITGKKVVGWPALFDAYNRKDWKGMAEQSHRRDVGKERNDRTYQLYSTAE